MMNKELLKEKLLKLEHKEVTEAQMNYDTFISESKLQENDIIDIDDSSHHWEDTDTSYNLDNQIHDHNKNLYILKETSFAPTSTVKPGAVVKVNDRFFIISISVPLFKFEGNSFLGISPLAPIYSAIQGKSKGAICTFNGIEFEIQDVL